MKELQSITCRLNFQLVADIDLVMALKRAAEKNGARYRIGITQSKDSFYGQHEPERMGVAADLLNRWKAWEIGGAICSEMEASALFVIASMLRVRAGGVMMVHAKEPMPPLDILLNTSIDALREIIAFDKANGRAVELSLAGFLYCIKHHRPELIEIKFESNINICC